MHNPMLAMLSPSDLMLLFAVAMLLFGPKRLPEIGKAMGEAIQGFKTASSGEEAARPVVRSTDSPAPVTEQTAQPPEAR